MVWAPPSRMLLDAKSLIRSAPAAARCRTASRICAGVPVFSVSGSSEVRTRGPGVAPEAIASRRSLSEAEPGLWTVVNPASRVVHALPAPAGDRLGEVLTVRAAGGRAGREGVVAVLDPGDADRRREPIAGHVLAASEDVPRALDDERRGSQVLQVLRAEPIGLARRMEG